MLKYSSKTWESVLPVSYEIFRLKVWKKICNDTELNMKR